MAAAVERPWPGSRILDPVRPLLAQKRRQHARLRQRGFAHPGIAEQKRKLAAFRRQGIDHRDRLALPPEEEIAVGFRHRLKAAVGPRMAPQLTRPRRRARCRIDQPADRRFGGWVVGHDPMKLARERQAWCRRPCAGQNQDQRIAWLLCTPIERLVILAPLIPASTLGALLIPALPFVVPSSEVSLARIWGLGARRVGKFTVVVSILLQSSADDGAYHYGQTSLLVGHRSSAEGRWIEARG